MVGVQAQHGLIQQHIGGVGGQGHHDLEDGAVPGGQLAHLGVCVQLEGPGQLPGELPVKFRIEHPAPLESVLHLHVLRVVELLAHQVQLGEGPVVAFDGLPVHGDAAPVGENALGQHVQQGGFPRAVASQQAVDLPLLQGEAHIFQRLHLVKALAHVFNDNAHNSSFSPWAKPRSMSFASSSRPMPSRLASATRLATKRS